MGVRGGPIEREQGRRLAFATRSSSSSRSSGAKEAFVVGSKHRRGRLEVPVPRRRAAQHKLQHALSAEREAEGKGGEGGVGIIQQADARYTHRLAAFIFVRQRNNRVVRIFLLKNAKFAQMKINSDCSDNDDTDTSYT
jgi:hypothetical protein